jgi:hypothetical protein
MPPKDDLGELVWICYGIVAGAFLAGGVIGFAKGHHSVNFSLTVGSWMVTFAALAWGVRAHRGHGTKGGGPPPATWVAEYTKELLSGRTEEYPRDKPNDS